MHVEVHSVTVTTDASGDATAYTSVRVNGLLNRIRYVKTDFDNTADFTITIEDTGESLWTESNVTASKVIAPRQPTHATDASASLYAAGGEPVEDLIAVDGRIKVVVAQGGNAKTGTFQFVLI